MRGPGPDRRSSSRVATGRLRALAATTLQPFISRAPAVPMWTLCAPLTRRRDSKGDAAPVHQERWLLMSRRLAANAA